MDVPDEVTGWLRQHATTFATTEPGSGLDDLGWFSGVVGDARVVALGEATHGTREFFTMKHRLVEHLVTRMGFDRFAIEASLPHAEAVDAYVRGSDGVPADLLAGLGFWTWHTEEVRDLLAWMRTHNRRATTQPVGFEGFDLQSPTASCAHVLAYLDLVDQSAAERARAAYNPFLIRLPPARLSQATMPGYHTTSATPAHQRYARASRGVQMACRRGLQAVLDDLLAARERYTLRSSAAAFERAAHHARLAVLGEELVRNSRVLWEATTGPRLRRYARLGQVMASTLAGSSVTARRDHAMADNVLWLLDRLGPSAKIVLWAHNLHVHNDRRRMGGRLREQLGDRYRCVGFSFSSGWYNAVAASDGTVGGLASHRVDGPDPGSWEAALDSTGLPRIALDLRTLPPEGDAVGDWLRSPRRHRNAGATADPRHPGRSRAWYRLHERYDLLIHLQHTTPARPLPIPSTTPGQRW